MDVFNDYSKRIFVLHSVRWAPLCEDGSFELGDVDFDTWFLSGVGVPVSITALDPSGTGPYLLICLGFIPCGDILDIDAFFVIMLIRIPSFILQL